MSRIYSLLFYLMVPLWSTDSQSMTSEQMANYKRFLGHQDRLFEKLFKSYDPGINAIYTLHSVPETNGTVHPPRFEITIQLSMMKLVEVVEPEEKATFLFDYRADWYDTRLSWDPEDYGGINHIYVPRSKVWIPETTIVDCSEIKVFDNEYTRYAWLHSNGSIGMYIASVTSVVCQMDVYKFPMDTHTCSVNFLFMTYQLEEFTIVGKTGTLPRPVEQLGNGEWQMKSIQIAFEPVVDNLTYLTKFEATFSRNPGFYIVLVMIPAYFINVLSIVALFMDINNRSEKFTVGMTNIMSMSFILVILAEDLPKTKNLPILAIYTVTSLAIMLCSLTAVVALPKLKAYYANRSLARGEKIPKNDEVPRTFWERIKFYFKVEYVFMLVFQIANFVNFIIIFT
ncbi:Neurotransmitter-gated ion-channel ligand-binding domain-containing protein [Caenorhabditis elegans]|uniref:Neurotransmitter-gated ion-channel ligand-binding domain-containing protein n=1 Tax=Caenorhabditis elegans TaxID=6239 RepID=Q4R170_CAEEL|nr:Neurotransmitter-gated ion-channel ligand-binding domain-containing protein [Caenorhabditis elegans]CCD74318.2 Neurotransmitter-gated ion-channel ligand-binding domain-containing protein [Caenorhabditis elegans]|eukprot:NP_001033513.2 Ligand-Gated ion Channel [Caenorhabditis elegans]